MNVFIFAFSFCIEKICTNALFNFEFAAIMKIEFNKLSTKRAPGTALLVTAGTNHFLADKKHRLDILFRQQLKTLGYMCRKRRSRYGDTVHIDWNAETEWEEFHAVNMRKTKGRK